MRRSNQSALLAVLAGAALVVPAGAQHVRHVDRSQNDAQTRGPQGQHVRHVDRSDQPSAPRHIDRPSFPSSRGGLMGVPARLPNVLGRNRSLPLERRITLPGLRDHDFDHRDHDHDFDHHDDHFFPVPGVVGGGHGHIGHDGLTVDGKFSDDHWKIHFHLGSPSLVHCDDPHHDHDHHGHHHGNWSYYSPWWYYSYGSYLRTRPIDGYYSNVADYTLRYPQLAQPPMQPAQPAPTEDDLTALEKASLYMQAEVLEQAIEYYREHLNADPEDVESMRALGLAMFEDERYEDGIAMIALAYRTDPMLARKPLELGALGIDGRRYDNLLARALHFAKRTDSASAHLAAAVLLQADDKVSGAARVLQRAERAGLPTEVVDAMRRELGVTVSRNG